MTPRNYAGISPEELSLQDARFAGAEAGQKGHGRSMCPYQDYTPEAVEWDKHRLQAIARSLAGSFC